MGGLLRRAGAPNDILCILNARFGPGDPLREMVAVHKEFNVFSGNYTLRQSYRLLHLVPSDHGERRLFYRFLDQLKNHPSDQDGVNGHDRIVKARRENLESRSPLPIYTKTHRARDDNRVVVTQGQPIAHEDQVYLIISTPILLPGEAPRRAPAAPKRGAQRKRSA